MTRTVAPFGMFRSFSGDSGLGAMSEAHMPSSPTADRGRGPRDGAGVMIPIRILTVYEIRPGLANRSAVEARWGFVCGWLWSCPSVNSQCSRRTQGAHPSHPHANHTPAQPTAPNAGVGSGEVKRGLIPGINHKPQANCDTESTHGRPGLPCGVLSYRLAARVDLLSLGSSARLCW